MSARCIIHMNKKEHNWNEVQVGIIKSFISYLFNFALPDLKNDVTINLVTLAEEEVNGINKSLQTASVDTQTRTCTIICKNRGMLDVLRSIAHECIHMAQRDRGDLKDDTVVSFYLPSENSAGYDLEYEAYGRSGIIVRNFRALLNKMFEKENKEVV